MRLCVQVRPTCNEGAPGRGWALFEEGVHCGGPWFTYPCISVSYTATDLEPGTIPELGTAHYHLQYS
jgi:hypothetical protein